MRDIGFEGTTSAHTFYVIDAADVRGLPDTSINLRLGPADFLLGFPMGQGRDARLVGVVPGERSGDAADLDAPLRERLAGFGITWGATNWLSTYQVHHRVAERFRDGPVFLAGDAAHVHSPVGAQGMNTGLQDAHNLACKLADVLQGRASDDYLDRYGAERMPVARHIISFTERMFGLAVSDRRAARVAKRVVVPVFAPVLAFLVPRVPALGRRAVRVRVADAHPLLAARLPPIGCPRPPRPGRRPPPAPVRRQPRVAAERSRGRCTRTEPCDPGALPPSRPRPGCPWCRSASPVGTTLRDGHLYLVRPDGFVAAEGVGDAAAEVLAAALPWHPAP